jgi:CBS-domain-containing membrane protein
MSTKVAGDIMIPLDEYPHIPHWFTLRQAVMELEKAEIIDKTGRRSLPRALLVFHEGYQLLGIVRRRDILRGLEPKFLRMMPLPERRKLFDIDVDINLIDLSSGKVANAMREQAEQKVSEVMQTITTTVQFDDHLAKIIYKMITQDLNLIPVLKDGKIIGVVRSVDVFHEIAGLLQ